MKKMLSKQSKVIRDGKVAVCISPGFGAGWSTWNDGVSPFEPKVVEMIEAGKQNKITTEWCKEKLGIKHVFCGGVEDLVVVWLPIGEKFSINDYDGSESLYIASELEFEA